MSHVSFTVERILQSYRTRNYSCHKLFVVMAIVGDRTCEVRGENVYRCATFGALCVGPCEWLARIDNRPDESVNVSKVNDDDDNDSDHFDRFRT